MRIGFDAKRAFCNSSGLGNYSRYTINALCRQFPENEYFLYTPKDCGTSLYTPEENAQVALPDSALARKMGGFWRSYALAGRAYKDKIDVYHGLSNELPNGISGFGIKSVVTVHDLIFMRMPKLYPAFDRYIYYRKSREAVKYANTIVAISEQTKRDMIELLRADERKIRVIYQGCHPWFYEQIEECAKDALRLKYKLPTQYLLTVGTIEERKNLLAVVRAIHEGELDIPLVVVGKKTAYYHEVIRYIQEKKINNILFLETVANKDLPVMYQSAVAFIYPSKYEGFGIPVLEALNSGIPVVSSAGGCLEETTGGGGLLVNPNDQEEITEAVRRVIVDSELRGRLVEEGGKHALKFRDEETIPQLMNVYKDLS